MGSSAPNGVTSISPGKCDGMYPLSVAVNVRSMLDPASTIAPLFRKFKFLVTPSDRASVTNSIYVAQPRSAPSDNRFTTPALLSPGILTLKAVEPPPSKFTT
jgi:hypothetical protein